MLQMHFQPHDWHWKFGNKLTTMLSHPSFAPAPKVVHCNLWTETHLSTMHMHTLVPTFCLSNLKKGIRRINHLQKEEALKKPRRAWRNMKKIAPRGTRKKGRNFQAPKVLKRRPCPQLYQPNTQTDRNFPKLLRLQTFLLPQFLLFPLTYPRTPKPQSCLRLILR